MPDPLWQPLASLFPSMSYSLFPMPYSPPQGISNLRKQADRACLQFAKFLRTDAETLWDAAMWNRFPSETFECQEGGIFWESFMALNRAEVAEIETRRFTALQ